MMGVVNLHFTQLPKIFGIGIMYAGKTLGKVMQSYPEVPQKHWDLYRPLTLTSLPVPGTWK